MPRLKKRSNNYTLPQLPIPNSAVTWLLFSLLLSIGWHIPHTPIWALGVAGVVIAHSYHRIIKNRPMLHKYIRIFMTIAAVAGILTNYHSYLGRDPGITSLILLSAMKMMEMKHRKDFIFIIFLCYFLVFGNFLYDQSIQDLIFTLIVSVLITAALLRLHHPTKEKVTFSFLMRFSLKLMIYSIPFTLLMFFLFPRTSGPLWNFSQDSMNRFRSGFNDSVEPGQIAQLAQSRLPAFQVEFPEGNEPEKKDLYFRGLVLWFTNGKRWVQGIMPSQYFSPQPFKGVGILQRITLHPHNQRWLFGLDWPVVMPGWSRIYPGEVFQAPRTVKGHYRYLVLSQANPSKLEPPTEKESGWALQLPREGSHRIIELGRKWRQESNSDQQILEKARQFFKQEGFAYTLNPGLMDAQEPIEDFLFNKRRGFCEHYSAAFALLMRAAGIPSRMVLGYQGGEYNPVGKYFLVRQSEAHAWVEIWLQDEGWQRIDPTGWVSPERIQYGVDLSQSLSGIQNLNEEERSSAIQRALNKNIFSRIFSFIKQHWDNINYKWDVWIISYDRLRQRDFFKGLGFETVNRFALIIALIVIIPIFFYSVSYILKRQTLSRDPLLKIYQKFCAKLSKEGIVRLQWEGPVHFQQRAIEKFPDRAAKIKQFNHLFIELRYGRTGTNKARIKELKHLLRRM
jgi:protein-glutamine gamma-glutamyltransferase